MDSKHALPAALAALLAALLSGCATLDYDRGWPEKRPLAPAYVTPRADPEEAPAASSLPSAADTLALGDALAAAMLENPRLEAFAYEVRAREAEAFQAGRWPNPTVSSGAAELGRGPRAATDLGAAELEGSISQRIPLGGEPGDRRRRGEARRDLAGWNYETARLGLYADVVQRYTGVLAAQERLALSAQLLDIAQQLFVTVRKQVEVGEVSPVELKRVRVELAQAKITRRRAVQEFAAARQQLAATWGGAAEAIGRIRPLGQGLPDVPALEELVPLIAQHPRLARFEAARRAREAQLDLEWARRLPDLTLSAGPQRFGESGETGFKVGLALPLPVFDRRRGAIAAARQRLLQIAAEHEAARTELLTELETAYRNLQASAQEVRTLREEVLPAAEEAFEAYRTGYRLGEFDLLKVLDAQRTFFDARLRYVQSVADYRQRAAEVERLVAAPVLDITSLEDSPDPC